MMNWYTGNIAEAVQLSKQKGAMFFVAIFGEDDLSKRLEESIDSSEILSTLSTERYVCVRLTAGSQEHLQFKQIYSNADSPCLYFISLMGAPVEIIHGEASVDDLKQTCESAWSKHSKVVQCQKSPPPTQVPGSSSDHPPVAQSPPVASDLSTQSTSNEALVSQEVSQSDEGATLTLEQKIERARQLSAARAQLKAEQEADDQRQREKERREAGKGMAELKRWQNEQEAKRHIEERKREKREEELLRKKLREQIAQDRAERNKRTNASIVYDGAEPSTSSGAQNLSVTTSSPANYEGKARLQFRMPDGSSQNHNFDQDATLGHVCKFLVDENHVKFRNFNLYAAFPRREFTTAEYDKSLKDLGLLPSAALLIIPTGGRVLSASSGGQGAGLWIWLTTLLGYLLFPVQYLFGMMQRALPSSGSSQPANPRPRPNPNENRLGGSGASGSERGARPDLGSGPGTSDDIRKRNVSQKKSSDGNVHRLRDQETDSDEDIGTWNGNSTQQKPR